MIHLLVVGPPERLEHLAARRSSVEVLQARGPEEAVEKLARNRRIDAVLLLAGTQNAEAARAIREDSLGPPPLFAPASADEVPGARRLPSDEPAELLDLLADALSD